jgi:uncharacterized protein YjeT (DUF2065 family)
MLSTVPGLVLVVTGLFVGLLPKGFCGSAFRPASDPSGGGCAATLDSYRTLGIALLLLGGMLLVAGLASARARG